MKEMKKFSIPLTMPEWAEIYEGIERKLQARERGVYGVDLRALLDKIDDEMGGKTA